MKRILITLLTVSVILSGTAFIDRYYQPKSTKTENLVLVFPGQSTDQEVQQLKREQRQQLLALLNRGSHNQLAQVKGIAIARSEAIYQARPFKKLEDVRKIRGIGKRTFTNIIAHAETSL